MSEYEGSGGRGGCVEETEYGEKGKEEKGCELNEPSWRMPKTVVQDGYRVVVFFFLMLRRPPRSKQSRSSAASDVYKRQSVTCHS